MSVVLTDTQFLGNFEAGRIHHSDWNHAAHVRAAWLCLASSTGYKEACGRLRAGLKAVAMHACVCGRAVNTYHETITTGYMRIIAARSRDGETFTDFRDRNGDLFVGHPLAPLFAHYSRDRLYSDAARKEYLRPDLAPLPRRGRQTRNRRAGERRLVPA